MTARKEKEFIKIGITEAEAYQIISQIPHLVKKVDEIVLILKGDDANDRKGIIDHVRETNGEVKLHQKLIFALFGLLGSLTIFIIIKGLGG